jgi:hypothetical protein
MSCEELGDYLKFNNPGPCGPLLGLQREACRASDVVDSKREDHARAA